MRGKLFGVWIKFMIVFILLFILAPLGTMPLIGECAASYTLEQLIDTGLKHNPSTKTAWWNAQRAAAALGSARSAYYPQVDFNASARNGRTFQFINGPDVNYTAFSGELILGLLLLDSGERESAVTAAKLALEAASWQSNWEIQSVMIAVLEHAYMLFYHEEALEAAIISRDDAKKILSHSEELNQAGLTPITDVYTGRATLALMEMEVSERAAAADIQRGKLAASIGFSADTPLRLAPFGAVQKGLQNVKQREQIGQLISLADSRRSDLFAQRARVQEAMATQAKVQASYLPKLSFRGRGGYDHDVGDKDRSFDYQVRLNLEVPLFTGFQATYQNQMARADVKISEQNLVQLQLDIALQVLTYTRNLEAAQAMIQQAESNLDNAKLAYEGVLEKYSAGQEKIAELSNALRQLTAARLKYSDVIARYLNAMANLAYATGTL